MMSEVKNFLVKLNPAKSMRDIYPVIPKDLRKQGKIKNPLMVFQG
jgi:hypothetical protein